MKQTREPTSDELAALRPLADAMVHRHIRNSIHHHSDRVALFGDAGWQSTRAPRIFFVVGAGASSPLYERADALATTLESQLEHSSMQDYKAELRRLSRVSNLPAHSFETKLAAMARSPHRLSALRHEIVRQFANRHPTLLAYEILSHLVKHRYVDGIINFNFDELLDQSLEDELGAGEFITVVSPRDVRHINRYQPQFNDYRPIYVKPHGTVADPTTLRFTREAYDDLPTAIREVLVQMFGSENVVLVSLGFGMQGFDFIEVLGGPDSLEIFNLGPHRLRPEAVTDMRSLLGEQVKHSIHETQCGEDTDSAMLALERALAERVKAHQAEGRPIRLRSTLRHQCITTLLQQPDLSNPQARLAYLERRAILEAAFSLVKGRGLVSVTTLAKDRVARYHQMCEELGTSKSWETILAYGGFVPSDLSAQTYLPLPILDTTPGFAENQEGGRDSTSFRAVDTDSTAEHVAANIGVTDLSSISLLCQTLKELSTRTEIEIHSTDDRICSRLFQTPKICPTMSSLTARTCTVIGHGATQTQIAISAETGAWLYSPEGHPGKALRDCIESSSASGDLYGWRVLLMVGFANHLDELARTFPTEGQGADSGLAVVRSSWWRHNVRMTIRLRNGIPGPAVYFARTRRTAFVTPVGLDDSSDSARAWNDYKLACLSSLRMTVLDLVVRNLDNHEMMEKVRESSAFRLVDRVKVSPSDSKPFASPPNAISTEIRSVTFDELWRAARDVGDLSSSIVA